MTTATITVDLTIEVIECAHCHIEFGITADFMRRRRNDHVGFCCPHGHSNVYNGKSEEEKLKEQLRRAKEDSAFWSNQTETARADRRAAQRSLAAQKGWNTRLKNRIKNGVCPCCNRSFANVRAHMAGQHPDFAIPE
jgi:hypothetical protein